MDDYQLQFLSYTFFSFTLENTDKRMSLSLTAFKQFPKVMYIFTFDAKDKHQQ